MNNGAGQEPAEQKEPHMFRLFCVVWVVSIMVLGPMTTPPLTDEQNKRIAEKFMMLSSMTPPTDQSVEAGGK